ncbi:MAG: peptide deformylase [Chloracidobacterium sp.]|nr:peptide deformylase [Chloracidobacterium sp.]
MAIRPITEYPADVLASRGEPVTEFGPELAELCRDMFDTMYDAEGVGLAAPQIGLGLRLFVMDCEGVKLIAANPERSLQWTESSPARKAACRSGKCRPLSSGRCGQLSRPKTRAAIGLNAKPRAMQHGPLCTRPTIVTGDCSSII